MITFTFPKTDHQISEIQDRANLTTLLKEQYRQYLQSSSIPAFLYKIVQGTKPQPRMYAICKYCPSKISYRYHQDKAVYILTKFNNHHQHPLKHKKSSQMQVVRDIFNSLPSLEFLKNKGEGKQLEKYVEDNYGVKGRIFKSVVREYTERGKNVKNIKQAIEDAGGKVTFYSVGGVAVFMHQQCSEFCEKYSFAGTQLRAVNQLGLQVILGFNSNWQIIVYGFGVNKNGERTLMDRFHEYLTSISSNPPQIIMTTHPSLDSHCHNLFDVISELEFKDFSISNKCMEMGIALTASQYKQHEEQALEMLNGVEQWNKFAQFQKMREKCCYAYCAHLRGLPRSQEINNKQSGIVNKMMKILHKSTTPSNFLNVFNFILKINSASRKMKICKIPFEEFIADKDKLTMRNIRENLSTSAFEQLIANLHASRKCVEENEGDALAVKTCDNQKEYVVKIDGTFQCSCGLCEQTGIPCPHILKCLSSYKQIWKHLHPFWQSLNFQNIDKNVTKSTRPKLTRRRK